MSVLTFYNTIEELQIGLDGMNKNDIEFFYLSIGSKLNENYVNLKNNKKHSNASYQMIPQFLRNPDESAKLKIIIIFDSFNKSDFAKNRDVLMKNSTFLTKIFVVNMELRNENFHLFETFILNVINLFDFLDNKHFMICNFVKHMNEPNYQEKESENLVENKIPILLKNTKFENNYYVWFGYNNKLYNFVFNKKDFSNLMNHYPNVKKLESYIETNDYHEEYIQISKNVYDLTDFENIYISGAPSLYDKLIL